MRPHGLILASFLLCVISYVQPPLVFSQQTFQVRGKIVDSHDSAIAGAEVKFAGSKTTQTVFSDSKGFYHANLPLGIYSMAVAKGPRDYRRPLFRISSSKTIELDVPLYPPLRSCDSGIISVTRPDGTLEKTETAITPDEFRDECGGWDRFPIFSAEGASFDLLVRYYGRRRTDGERVYDGGFQNPVVVAFNLFTLTADHIVYDMARKTLLATGNVTTTNGAGASTHASSMKFRIANDSAEPLPHGRAPH